MFILISFFLALFLICFLPSSLSATTPTIEITWYGHASITIYDGSTRILIDPFFQGNPHAPCTWKELPRIDYILLTHDHSDHRGDAIAIATHYSAHVSGVVETMEALIEQGLPQDHIFNGIGFNIGGSISVGDFTVLMVPAVHTSTTGLAVGYIITTAHGFRIYHAGDTAPYGDMKLWSSWYPLDVAIIPIGGHFTQDAFLAAQSAKLLRARYTLPIHYGTFPLLSSTPEALQRHLKEEHVDTKLLLPNIGESLSF